MTVHIGKEIEKIFQESGLKIGHFADRINTGERNVYSIFNRKDISADMLAKISRVLDFDFFKLYQDQLDGLLKEPEVPYRRAIDEISLTITVTGPLDHYYEHFADLLRELISTSGKFGFKLK